MNWVDFVMLGILAAFLIYGVTRGFLRQILGILGVVAALFLAAYFTPSLAEARFLDDLRARNPNLPRMAAYIGIFIGAAVLFGIITSFITRSGPRRELKSTNSFLGAVLGALQGVLILGGVSIGLLEWDDPRADPVKKSVLAPRLAEGCKAIVLLIPEDGRKEIKEGFDQGKKSVEESLPEPGKKSPRTYSDPPTKG